MQQNHENNGEVLRVENLWRSYGKGSNVCHALRGVSFTIQRGEFVGIMGPSGAGKSTLLNLLATIDRPSEGTVIIDGMDVYTQGEKKIADFRREKLGFLFQEYNLLNQMNVLENITLPLSLRKEKAEVQKQKALALAELLHIEHLLDKQPTMLSGGEKQRAAAARAMITEPSLLLADEPTGALDSKASRELLECLQTMNQQRRVTIVMVTHDEGAAKYCQRILYIEDGKLVSV